MIAKLIRFDRGQSVEATCLNNGEEQAGLANHRGRAAPALRR